jgi:hypothetical protein
VTDDRLELAVARDRAACPETGEPSRPRGRPHGGMTVIACESPGGELAVDHEKLRAALA